jgi:hypothetical protein
MIIYNEGTVLKTEHGGRATIVRHVAEGVYLTNSGVFMEDIDGVLYDLKWTMNGRVFRRRDGREMAISISGKVMKQ